MRRGELVYEQTVILILLAAATLILALIVYLGATALGSPVPFLASLGAALVTWTIGCVLDA